MAMTSSAECHRPLSVASSTVSSRGSYPSKQKKFGPAPLASFEDLQTDEAQSGGSSEEDERRTLVGESISIVISDESAPLASSRTPTSSTPSVVSQVASLLFSSPSIATTQHSAMQPSIDDPVERIALLSGHSSTLSSSHQRTTSLSPQLSTGQSEAPRKSSWISDMFSLRRPSSGTSPNNSAKLNDTRKLSLFNFKFFDNKADSKSLNGAPAAECCEMQRLDPNGCYSDRSTPSVASTSSSLQENTVIEIGCPIDYDNFEPMVELRNGTSKPTHQSTQAPKSIEVVVVVNGDPHLCADSIGSCPSSCSSIIGCRQPDPELVGASTRRQVTSAGAALRRASSVSSISSTLSSASSSSDSSVSSASCPHCATSAASCDDNEDDAPNDGLDCCLDCDKQQMKPPRADEDALSLSSSSSCCDGSDIDDCCGETGNANADAEDNDNDDNFNGPIRAQSNASVTELQFLLKHPHDDVELDDACSPAPPSTLLSKPRLILSEVSESKNRKTSTDSVCNNLLSPEWPQNGANPCKTSPVIERPRSITPNPPSILGSFEAFVEQATRTNDARRKSTVGECDKLTIKLPGVHLSPRGGGPRKSNPHIWAEFCERGLVMNRSPEASAAAALVSSSLRKRANSCFPQLSELKPIFPDVGKGPINSPDNLTPITPIRDGDVVYSEDEQSSDRNGHFGDQFWIALASNCNPAPMCDCDDSDSTCITSSSSVSSECRRPARGGPRPTRHEAETSKSSDEEHESSLNLSTATGQLEDRPLVQHHSSPPLTALCCVTPASAHTVISLTTPTTTTNTEDEWCCSASIITQPSESSLTPSTSLTSTSSSSTNSSCDGDNSSNDFSVHSQSSQASHTHLLESESFIREH